MEEKEYYKYTFKELTAKVGDEKAREIAHFYKLDFLIKYPTTKRVLAGNLIKTTRMRYRAKPKYC
jgi:hypothetical protein